MSDPAYDAIFYANLQEGARRSAQRVLPLVFDRIQPATVVDFGCGSGGWLAEAEALGTTGLGLDGPWVPHESLEIAVDRFLEADLSKPIDLGRNFDLALCLEVAEHLPVEAAAILVGTLTRHAPAILFSAAIPDQGGTDHLNEAWPQNWCDLFADAGFDCLDVLRKEIWNDPLIEPWYRQNLLLFMRRNSNLGADKDKSQTAALALIHPDIWSARVQADEVRQARLDAAEAEVIRLGNAWQALSDEKAEAIARLEVELAASKRAMNQVLTSRSWRITRPLRRLDRMLRGSKNAG